MAQLPELAKPSLTESTTEDEPAQCLECVFAYPSGAKLAGAARLVWQRYLDVVLGAVLVLAGALKAHQLLTDPSAGRVSGFPRELLIGAAAFELTFGCWLIGGLYRRLTRWLALVWFASLAGVALAQTAGGATSCACLGELHICPWLMLAFDAAALVALWMWCPNARSSARLFPAVLFFSLLPAVGLFGLTSATPHEPMFAEIDLGDIAQGGQKQQTFHLRNDSGRLVEVAAIETTCPCVRFRLERTGVPAGQFLASNVEVDLRSKPEFTGNLAIKARGFTQNGQLAFVLMIWAQVQPAS